MRYHRLFADAAGESRWQDVEVDLQERRFPPPAKMIETSEPDRAIQTLFLRLRAGWDEPIHPTPVRQRLACLAGRIEVTASDDESRQTGPGDVWQMEDRSGKGHHTKVISDEDFEAVIIQFD